MAKSKAKRVTSKAKGKKGKTKKSVVGAAQARALLASLAQARGADAVAGTFTLKAPKLETGSPLVARASNLKHVCRSYIAGAACFVPYRGKLKKKATWKSLGLTGKTTAAKKRAACARAGGTVQPERKRSIKPGKVELDFLSTAQANKLGLDEPGAYLRLCRVNDGRGYLVPVSAPDDVKVYVEEFKECVKGRMKNMPRCAAQTAATAWPERSKLPLGGFFGVR